MSIRQQIVDAIEARLKTIATGATVTVNGALHTYSFTPAVLNVWRITPLGDNELPAINVRDEEADVAGAEEIGRLEHVLALAVSVADIGETSPAAIRARLLDITRAIGATPTLGGLVHRLRLVGHGLDTELSKQRLTVGTVNFEIHYRTPPYTL